MGLLDLFRKKKPTSEREVEEAPQERAVPKEKKAPAPGFRAPRRDEDGLYPLASCVSPWEISERTQQFVVESALVTPDGEETGANKTTLEFMQLGLDMIPFARRSFGKSLTLSEQDIYLLEEMAAEAHIASLKGDMSKEQLVLFSKLVAGYFGLLVGIHKGGEWEASVPGQEDNGPAMYQGAGPRYFVLGKVVRRIQKGKVDDLLTFYRSIPYCRT